jgi:RNA polymerase sigma factor (sigma-70 family)
MGNPPLDDYWNYDFVNAIKESGLSYEQVAEQAEVSPAAISNYARLRAFPSPVIRRRLGRILRTDPDDIFPIQLKGIISGVQRERKAQKDFSDPLDIAVGFRDVSREHPTLYSKDPDYNQNPDLRKRFAEVLKTLYYRERNILLLRTGLGDGFTYTLEEVAYIFKISRERVHQTEVRAQRKLRHPSRSGGLVEFFD